jgi:hypothetical protein
VTDDKALDWCSTPLTGGKHRENLEEERCRPVIDTELELAQYLTTKMMGCIVSDESRFSMIFKLVESRLAQCDTVRAIPSSLKVATRPGGCVPGKNDPSNIINFYCLFIRSIDMCALYQSESQQVHRHGDIVRRRQSSADARSVNMANSYFNSAGMAAVLSPTCNPPLSLPTFQKALHPGRTVLNGVEVVVDRAMAIGCPRKPLKGLVVLVGC